MQTTDSSPTTAQFWQTIIQSLATLPGPCRPLCGRQISLVGLMGKLSMNVMSLMAIYRLYTDHGSTTLNQSQTRRQMTTNPTKSRFVEQNG